MFREAHIKYTLILGLMRSCCSPHLNTNIKNAKYDDEGHSLSL